jgi:hypothetical protein
MGRVYQKVIVTSRTKNTKRKNEKTENGKAVRKVARKKRKSL